MSSSGELGKAYADGELIIRAGETGSCMYVIQEGRVEVYTVKNGREVRLAVREAGDFFGEMAIFEREKRSANVRAMGGARVLTIDKSNFLRRIHEDPTLAFRIVQEMSSRIRELSETVARLSAERDRE